MIATSVPIHEQFITRDCFPALFAGYKFTAGGKRVIDPQGVFVEQISVQFNIPRHDLCTR
jgi:hypothetical protein